MNTRNGGRSTREFGSNYEEAFLSPRLTGLINIVHVSTGLSGETENWPEDAENDF